DRDDEFEQIYANAACRIEQAAAEGFKMWCRLNDEPPKVGRSKQPTLVDLFTNERPSFYRFGRRRNVRLPSPTRLMSIRTDSAKLRASQVAGPSITRRPSTLIATAVNARWP